MGFGFRIAIRGGNVVMGFGKIMGSTWALASLLVVLSRCCSVVGNYIIRQLATTTSFVVVFVG